jgi:hypothetical protein
LKDFVAAILQSGSGGQDEASSSSQSALPKEYEQIVMHDNYSKIDSPNPSTSLNEIFRALYTSCLSLFAPSFLCYRYGWMLSVLDTLMSSERALKNTSLTNFICSCFSKYPLPESHQAKLLSSARLGQNKSLESSKISKKQFTNKELFISAVYDSNSKPKSETLTLIVRLYTDQNQSMSTQSSMETSVETVSAAVSKSPLSAIKLDLNSSYPSFQIKPPSEIQLMRNVIRQDVELESSFDPLPKKSVYTNPTDFRLSLLSLPIF